MCVSFRSLASTPDIDDVSARGFVSFHRTGVPARVEEHARARARMRVLIFASPRVVGAWGFQ